MDNIILNIISQFKSVFGWLKTNRYITANLHILQFNIIVIIKLFI